MTGLLDLPSELISQIVSYLNDHDLRVVRYVARHVERASMSLFGRRFFRKRGYLITSPSLGVLQSIAEHPELRKFVQHIWFNPDCYTFAPPHRSDATESRVKSYLECVDDHKSLMKVERLSAQLTEILALLPNLVVVGMRRSEDHAPWGWRRLLETVGQDPRVLGPIPNGPMLALSGPTILFASIINAVAATRIRLTRLYTDAIEIDNIDPGILPQEKFNEACGSILYLELNSTRGWLVPRPRADFVQLLEPSEYGCGLLRLLKSTTKLKELGLQIFPDRKQSHMVAPRQTAESWRQSYAWACLDQMATGVHLQHLSRIKLEKVTTSPTTLQGILSPSASTLTSVKIRDVRLLSEPNDKKGRPWQPIFAFLQSSCRNLEYLLLYHLMYELGGVSFAECPPLPLPPLQTDVTGSSNPRFDEPSMEELFTKYEHIAMEGRGRADVQMKLDGVVAHHWYHQPIFSYAMDEDVWHTDTSDDEDE